LRSGVVPVVTWSRNPSDHLVGQFHLRSDLLIVAPRRDSQNDRRVRRSRSLRRRCALVTCRRWACCDRAPAPPSPTEVIDVVLKRRTRQACGNPHSFEGSTVCPQVVDSLISKSWSYASAEVGVLS